MQHRRRDGRRADVTPNVITSRRPQVDLECARTSHHFPGQQLAGKHAPNVTWLWQYFPDERDRILQKI